MKVRPSPYAPQGGTHSWRLGHLAASIKSPRVVTDFDSGFRRPYSGIWQPQGFDLVEWRLGEVWWRCVMV